jgi:hypothetical protein
VEKNWLKGFCEMIRHVDGGVDAIEEDEVAFDPFAQGEILDIDMSCSWGRFLSVAHSGASAVVLIE